MKDIAVVICNYNKKDLILKCVESVLKSDFDNFDIVVVDNASTDGSVEALQSQFGQSILIIETGANLGGSGGFACGMKYALEKEYKYIHLLDNDVEVESHAIQALFDFLQSHDEAGACGSLICKMNERDVIQEYGAMIDYNLYDINLLYKNEPVSTVVPSELICDYVAACSAMYRTSTLKKSGIIDKSYFIYWDDIALSKEIWNAGYKVYAISKSVVWHYGAAKGRSLFSRYYVFRNKIRYFTTYLSDTEFESYYIFLMERLFRMFSVNRHNKAVSATYFHALNDALNGINGQAEQHKLEEGLEKQKIPDNLEVITVEHVLDEKTYRNDVVYKDQYDNLLFGDEDLEYIKNMDMYKSFFQSIFHEYLHSKLSALRKSEQKNG